MSRIDSISGHESSPTIQNFPPLDPVRKSQGPLSTHGHDSIASWKEQPLWAPGKDSVVESLSINARATTASITDGETKRGFLDTLSGYAQSAFDKVVNAGKYLYEKAYTFIWGVSPYAVNAASEAAMSEMQRKRISDAIDAMIKALERIQEVAKEDGAEETNSEDKKRFFSFIEILKNDAIILQKKLADNAEAVSILHKATRDNLAKSREARGGMHDAAANSTIANGLLNVSSFFALVTGLFNIVELAGYVSSATPAGAALIAIGRLGSIAAMGANGAARMARASFEDKRIKHELEIERVKYENQKNDREVKNLSQDISSINQSIAIPESYIADLIKSLDSLKNSMLDYK